MDLIDQRINGDPFSQPQSTHPHHQAATSVGIFFDEASFEGYPFDDPDYRIAYYELAKIIASRGARIYILRDASTHLGGNTFRGGWELKDGEFVRVEEEITPDILYDKGQRLEPDERTVMMNDLAFDRMCTNKWETYRRLARFFPKTILVREKQDIKRADRELEGDILVAKPLDEEQGRGVIVDKRRKVCASINTFPYLVQEFLDTRGGIPGIVEGPHDLRMLSVNGSLLSSYVRMPKIGTLVANVGQGGAWRGIPVDSLPTEAVLLFGEIDRALAEFPHRAFSIDVGLHKDGTWKVFEINSKPALSRLGMHEGATEFMMRIADLLLSDVRHS
jgi:glutathione synthase/RimK-type ligase-like ATP-grasp enzyme